MGSKPSKNRKFRDRGAPAALYIGKVLHARLRPVKHRFTYRIFMMLLDLDRLDAAGRMSGFFSVGRFNLLSFDERDHLPSPPVPGSRIADRARALLVGSGIDVESCRIMLLCIPRVLNYAFNPISLFYAIDANGDLRGVIYEVRNTFGGRHVYLASAAGLKPLERHRLHKQFHVSPFLPMNLEYRFSVGVPDQSVALRIIEHDAEGPVLSTGFVGNRKNLTNSNALRVFFRLPIMTLKVILAIHFEALRLYIKGLRVYPNPGREPRR